MDQLNGDQTHILHTHAIKKSVKVEIEIEISPVYGEYRPHEILFDEKLNGEYKLSVSVCCWRSLQRCTII